MTRDRDATLGMRRRAARIAAVQALYQLELGGGAAEGVVEEFHLHHLRHEDARAEQEQIDDALFTDIVRGAAGKRDALDGLVGGALDKDRSVERLEAVMRAILRAGAYELSERADIDPALTIHEYVSVAKSFFNEREPALVNAVLDRIMHHLADGKSEADPTHAVTQDG
jgi:N utilization substance protein B